MEEVLIKIKKEREVGDSQVSVLVVTDWDDIAVKMKRYICDSLLHLASRSLLSAHPHPYASTPSVNPAAVLSNMVQWRLEPIAAVPDYD
jgi:hypothetical protein